MTLCMLWSAAAAGLSLDASISDLRQTSWGPNEGAPDGVSALAQSSDGYLWIGTTGGLFKFDGIHFDHVDLPQVKGISSVNIWSLYAPTDGGLWIGFTFGGVALLKDGELTVYTEREGLPPGSVKAIVTDLDGTLWAGTTTGLARLNGSRWQKVDAALGFPGTQIGSLLVDSAGTLWVSSKNQVFYRPKDEIEFRKSGAPLTESDNGQGVGITESPTGDVWAISDQELRLVRKNRIGAAKVNSSGLEASFDRDGALWVLLNESRVVERLTHPEEVKSASWDAIRKSSPGYSSYGVSAGTAVSPSILEDHEGNIWVAFATQLTRFSERNVTQVLPTDADGVGLPQAATASFVPDDQGGMWVVGRDSPVFRLDGRKWQRHEDIRYISAAIGTDDGGIWFGGRNGLVHYSDGRAKRVSLPQDSDNFEVQAMAEDPAGGLWVSIVRRGVYRRTGDTWTLNGGIPALPKLTAVTLATDARGRVWFGYTDGQAAVLDGNQVTVFSDQNRIPVGNVTAIYGKRGKIWVGGELGLAAFDGTKFVVIKSEVPNAFNSVTGIVETRNGDIWVNSRAGIVHLTAGETRRAVADPSYSVRGEVFDARDGVLGSSSRLRPLPSAIEGSDGRLWFMTNIGMYSIDPAHIHRNPVPPPVLIEAVLADNQEFRPKGALMLPPRTTSVRIGYVGLSLTAAEKVRYRYKLDGVDKDWHNVEGRREAYYTNLAPGPYRFRVLAANNDGVWNEAGAALNFTIPPTFMQTPWFVVLCVLAGSAIVWALVRIRVRQSAARMRGRIEERLAERERIARELHDTLLQSTQGLVLRFQAVANRIPPDDPTRDMLERALDRADEVIAEGRDRVLDLRVPVDTMSDLPKAFAQAGEDLAEGRDIAFKTIVEGTPRDLLRSAKDEAYRIGREALLNAFQHSGARAIEVQLVYGDADLRIRVRDDGRGIDPSALDRGARPGHWGLQGMSERAKEMGAELAIWSREGAGTEIELRLPAAVAYWARHNFWRWLPFSQLL